MKKKSFTLMEILIAILVFSIGILAVLRVITGNISVMDYTNRKMQSTVLAKEGIELLYNVRDSNLQKNLSRNCVMNPSVYLLQPEDLSSMVNGIQNGSFENVICSDHFGTNKILQLSFNKDYYIIQKVLPNVEDFDMLFDLNQLCIYKDTDANMSWYAYCKDEDGGQETFFARYLSFSLVNFAEESSSIRAGVINGVQASAVPMANNKILKVESHVLYRKGGKTGDVVFESFIGNY